MTSNKLQNSFQLMLATLHMPLPSADSAVRGRSSLLTVQFPPMSGTTVLLYL